MLQEFSLQMLITFKILGYNVEYFINDRVCFNLLDAGGDLRIRPLWRHYIGQNTNIVLFVVDCADRARIDEARDELAKLVSF